MSRYIVLLLITGIVWAQTDFDTLVLKDGTTYFGEYSKIEEEIVYFKPQNAFAFQPISIKKIKILQLKDGQFIIGSSSDILTYEENQKESLEEYQKFSAKEKEIYDAKSRKFKYVVGVIIVTVVFVALVADFFKPNFSSRSGLDCGPPCGGTVDLP